MSQVSLGDLAQSLMLRHKNAQIRHDVNRLAEEVATGRVSDISSQLSGDFVYLSEIERNLGLIEGYRTSVSEAAIFTSAMQSALGQISDVSENLSRTLLDQADTGQTFLPFVQARTANEALGQIVSALNSQTAGRSLFAGNATDQPAVATAETLITALRTAIAGQTSALDIKAAVDSWFDAPSGGFDAIVYQGSAEGISPYRLGRYGTLELHVRADTEVLRETLKNVALSVLASDPNITLPEPVRSDLSRYAATGLLTSQNGLTTLRADLGFAEARIEEARVRLSSERTSFEIARSAILSVDAFETATLLENAQSQLESLYAVTVRLSRLSLAEFMR